MLTKSECRALASKQLGLDGKQSSEWLIYEDTLEFEFGWVFFWQSKTYIETQDSRQALLGNAPIIVDKYNGHVEFTGTAHSLETYIDAYLIKHYNKQIKWKIHESSFPFSEIDRVKWQNAFIAAFGYELQQASELVSNLNELEFSTREEINKLKSKLSLRRIKKIEIIKIVVDNK